MSSMPASYQHIKTAIRTQGFDVFDELYNAFLTQVKQFEDDADSQRNASALPGQQQPDPQFQAFMAQPHVAQAFQAFRGGKGGKGGRARGGRSVPA